jgi:hypothetical protein
LQVVDFQVNEAEHDAFAEFFPEVPASQPMTTENPVLALQTITEDVSDSMPKLADVQAIPEEENVSDSIPKLADSKANPKHFIDFSDSMPKVAESQSIPGEVGDFNSTAKEVDMAGSHFEGIDLSNIPDTQLAPCGDADYAVKLHEQLNGGSSYGASSSSSSSTNPSSIKNDLEEHLAKLKQKLADKYLPLI